jgi:hypothetical protein
MEHYSANVHRCRGRVPLHRERSSVGHVP